MRTCGADAEDIGNLSVPGFAGDRGGSA